MKNLLKISFAVVAFAAVGLGSYKAYGSYTAANMSEEDLLIAENVLALSDDGGINIDYCYQSSETGLGGTKTVCASGTTTVSTLGNGTPTGTIYPCSGSQINGSLTSSLGYCYKSAK